MVNCSLTRAIMLINTGDLSLFAILIVVILT